MDLFLKAAAGILMTLILSQAIHGKDMKLLLLIAACSMVGALTVSYLEPVLLFLERLQQLGDLQDHMLKILLKILGIGMLTELMETICKDLGNSSLGKAAGLMGTAVILWLSLPIFSSLLDLIDKILGAL